MKDAMKARTFLKSFCWIILPVSLAFDAAIIYGCYRIWHHLGQWVELSVRRIGN